RTEIAAEETKLKAASHHFRINTSSEAMSTTAFRSPVAENRRALSSSSRIPTRHEQLAPFVDLEPSPYPYNDLAGNPVADLIPDAMYEMLLANNLISEKGVRDYIIRKAFRAMKEKEDLKSCEALARLQ